MLWQFHQNLDLLPCCYPIVFGKRFCNASRRASSTRAAASACMPGMKCEQRSRVIPTLEWPSRSLATFGWTPLASIWAACACRRSWKRIRGRAFPQARYQDRRFFFCRPFIGLPLKNRSIDRMRTIHRWSDLVEAQERGQYDARAKVEADRHGGFYRCILVLQSTHSNFTNRSPNTGAYAHSTAVSPASANQSTEIGSYTNSAGSNGAARNPTA